VSRYLGVVDRIGHRRMEAAKGAHLNQLAQRSVIDA